MYSNCLVDMDDERESVMMSAEEQKENDLQVFEPPFLNQG